MLMTLPAALREQRAHCVSPLEKHCAHARRTHRALSPEGALLIFRGKTGALSGRKSNISQ
jgi:hypothetical protein